MKKIMFFDTETTGVKPDDRIMQFGAIVGSYDEVNNVWYEERIINQYINSEKEPCPEAFKVHKITLDFASKFGTMNDYIKEFLAYMRQCDYIVGHNIEYDWRMLNQDMTRLGIKNPITAKRFCTMKESTDLCKIPGGFNGGFKRPKLKDLHLHLFNTEFENAHDAMADITATKNCFLEMVKLGLFTI